MLLTDDMELVRAYVAQGSEEAFETILNRHLNLVYSTALRQVRDPVLAGEVTQTTFIILARKAASLGPGTILPGWLYRTAQFAAARAMRTEARRREREKEAVHMQIEPTESLWEQLSPILDQAMAHLGSADRNALVLRYFENKTAKDVGAALGINEAAAQKRLVRAVDKLRLFCTKRGVVLSAAALTGVLTANAVQAAPAGVAAATSAVLKGGAVSASTGALTAGTLKSIAWVKVKLAAMAGLGATAVGVGVVAMVTLGHWSEPSYGNRHSSSWLEQLDNHENAFSTELPWVPWQTEVGMSPQQLEAVRAIRAMETNVMPQLIAALKKNDLSRLESLFGRSPAQIEAWHRQAALALDTLGPECKPWLPELSDLLYNGNCRKEAAIGLAAIGPEGWEVLKQATTMDSDTAPCAIWALGSHRIHAPGVEEILMASYLRNKPVGMDIVSLWALAEIQPNHEKLVPLLIDGLHSTRQDLKWGSAVMLGRLGSEARPAVPELQKLLGDANPMVRRDAAQALWEIDPQMAAQAGVNQVASVHVPRTTLY